MISILLLLVISSASSLSLNGKTTLSQLRQMRLEAVQLLDTITNEEQMDLVGFLFVVDYKRLQVETILNREEEEEESNQINQEPLMVTNSDLDDTSRNVLMKLRDLKDKEKDLLKTLESTEEFKTVSFCFICGL